MCQLGKEISPCNAVGRSAVIILLDRTHWLEALSQFLKFNTLVGKYFSFTYYFLMKTKYFNCKWSQEFFCFFSHDYFKFIQ